MIMMLLDERGERFGANHRHVARQHEQSRIFVFEKFTRRVDRVSRAELFFLPDKFGLFDFDFVQHGVFDFFALMSDDDVNFVRRECRRRPANVINQRATVNFVQHLRQIRAHSGSQSGG